MHYMQLRLKDSKNRILLEKNNVSLTKLKIPIKTWKLVLKKNNSNDKYMYININNKYMYS